MTRHRVRLATVGILACVPLLLSACGSDDPDTGATDDTETSAAEETGGGDDGATGEATIVIQDFAYGDPLTVAPGTEVTVTNEDSAPHNANDAGGEWEFDLLQQGESTTFTAPDEAATYDLLCTQHPDMSGQLIVEG